MIIDLENKIKQIKYDQPSGLDPGLSSISSENLSWQGADGELKPEDAVRRDMLRIEGESVLDGVSSMPAADLNFLQQAANQEIPKQPFLNPEEKQKLDELRGKISPEDKTKSEVDAFWDPEKQPILNPSLGIDESQSPGPRMSLDDALKEPSLSDVKEQLGGLQKDIQPEVTEVIEVSEQAEQAGNEQPKKVESTIDASQASELDKIKKESWNLKGRPDGYEPTTEIMRELNELSDKPVRFDAVIGEADAKIFMDLMAKARETNISDLSDEDKSKLVELSKKINLNAKELIEKKKIEKNQQGQVIEPKKQKTVAQGVANTIYKIARFPGDVIKATKELSAQNNAAAGSPPLNPPGGGGGDNQEGPIGPDNQEGPKNPEVPSSGNEIKDILNATKVTEMKDGTFENDLNGLRKKIAESESFKNLPLPVRASIEARMKFQAEYLNQQKNVDNLKTAEAKAETNLEKWKTFQNQAKLLAKRVGYLLPAAIIAFSGLPFSAIYLPFLGTAAGGVLYGRMNINDKELSLEILKSKRKAEESKSKIIEIKAQRQNRSDSALTSYVKTMALVSANQRGEDQETTIKNAMNSTGIGILPLVR